MDGGERIDHVAVSGLDLGHDGPGDPEAFRPLGHEERSSGQDLPGAITLADRIVENHGSLERLRRSGDEFLEEFREQGLEV